MFSLPAFAWVGLEGQPATSPLSLRRWGWVTALRAAGLLRGQHSGLHGLAVHHRQPGRLILFTYPTLTMPDRRGLSGQNRIAAADRCPAAVLRRHWLAFAHDLHIAGEMRAVLIGAAFVADSSMSYAFYRAGSRPVIRRLGAARFTALAMLSLPWPHCSCREPACEVLAGRRRCCCAVGMAVVPYRAAGVHDLGSHSARIGARARSSAR